MRQAHPTGSSKYFHPDDDDDEQVGLSSCASCPNELQESGALRKDERSEDEQGN